MLPAGVEIALKQIQDKATRPTLRKAVAMKGHPFGSGKLHPDIIVIFQPNRIIGGPGDLMAVVIMGGIARSWIRLGPGLQPEIPGIRHKEDVAEVRDAGAAKVVLGESDNDTVGIVVAGAPVPTFVDVGGSDLDGAERNAGPEKGMAMSAGANVWVDGGQKGPFGRDVGGLLSVEGCQREGGEEDEDGFHGVNISVCFRVVS